jgi:hypothetical protein
MKRILSVFMLCILASCAGKKELRPPPAPPPAPSPAPAPAPAPKLDVLQLRLVSKGEFVGLRFRVTGVETFDPGATDAYLIDESTGEKFPVVRLQRIGRLAEFTVPGEKGVHNILFRNRQGKLKLGRRVTVVFGSIRKEHLLVQE